VRVDADDQGVRAVGGGRRYEGAVTGTEVDDDLRVPVDEGSESADVELDEPPSSQHAHRDSVHVPGSPRASVK
jgi:hypothetical protein